MKFDRAGKVITNINFKNTGNVMFNNFSGFSNHDLSLNKDGQEIRLINGKKAGNYIPMRSLGNERGMYIQSKNNQMRTSIYTNSPNGPYAWSARSYGYAYKATKGHMVSPGVLGIGYREHSYYPWAKGRRKPSKKYFDKSEGHYKLNYVAKVSNSFNSQRDLGDKNNNLVAGARISAKEKDPTWDAGLTMRTAPTDLKVDDSVNLEYITQNDVNNNLFSPVLEIDNKYTFDDPEIMKKGQDKLEIKCSWYDFDSTSETLYYSIDSDEESERQILLNAKQTSDEAVDGKIHELKGSIPLRGLSKGKHKIHLIMQDKEGNFSQVEEHVIFILHEASEENIAPSIAVMSPHSSEDEIHSPRDHSIDIKGIWHDKDSKEIKSITYQLDNEKETLLSENLDNSGFNEHNKWEIDKLDIKSKNDFDKHTIKFKITDAEGNIGTDEFHFKHVAGLYDLVAPDEFTFGQIVISSTDEIINSPKIQHDAKKNDNLVFRDWREKGSNPVGISLTINNFYKKEDLDDTDDGDDSEEDMDDDARKLNVESLIHQVYWKDKLVNGKSLLIGQSKGPKSDSWEESVDLTDDVLKQLRIGFKSHPDKQSLGDYSSRWTWQVVDSIQ